MTNDTPPSLTSELRERFLLVLGVARREPALDALRDLVGAFVSRIPFENVSKVYRWKRHGLTTVPDAATFLDGIEQFGFGGTCYSNNYHLYALLASLGYRVTLCGADMRNPDVHVVVRAELEGRELLLDAGYAAPFLEPLPLDLDRDHVVALGTDRYVLKPKDAEGRSRLELHRDGQVRHGYLMKPTPRCIEDFAGVVADSFRPEATFLNALLLARFRPNEAIYVRNLTVLEARGTATTSRTLRDRDELIAVIPDLLSYPS